MFLERFKAKLLCNTVRNVLLHLPQMTSLCIEYSNSTPSPYCGVAWNVCAILVGDLELRIGEVGCVQIANLSPSLHLPNIRSLKLVFQPYNMAWAFRNPLEDKAINMALQRLRTLIPSNLETLKIELWNCTVDSQVHEVSQGSLNHFNQQRNVGFLSFYSTQSPAIFSDVLHVLKTNVDTLVYIDIRIQEPRTNPLDVSLAWGANLEHLQMDGPPFFVRREKYFTQLAQCSKLKMLKLIEPTFPHLRAEPIPYEVMNSFLRDLFDSLYRTSQQLLYLQLPIPNLDFPILASVPHTFPNLQQIVFSPTPLSIP